MPWGVVEVALLEVAILKEVVVLSDEDHFVIECYPHLVRLLIGRHIDCLLEKDLYDQLLLIHTIHIPVKLQVLLLRIVPWNRFEVNQRPLTATLFDFAILECVNIRQFYHRHREVNV